MAEWGFEPDLSPNPEPLCRNSHWKRCQAGWRRMIVLPLLKRFHFKIWPFAHLNTLFLLGKDTVLYLMLYTFQHVRNVCLHVSGCVYATFPHSWLDTGLQFLSSIGPIMHCNFNTLRPITNITFCSWCIAKWQLCVVLWNSELWDY